MAEDRGDRDTQEDRPATHPPAEGEDADGEGGPKGNPEVDEEALRYRQLETERRRRDRKEGEDGSGGRRSDG